MDDVADTVDVHHHQITGTIEDLITGIHESGGVILEARGRDTWTFRLRFENHENLKRFYNYLIDAQISLTLDRITDLTADDQTAVHGLTVEQLEALQLALSRGYFSVPREVSVQELADEFDISDQAMSERLRRGLELLKERRGGRWGERVSHRTAQVVLSPAHDTLK